MEVFVLGEGSYSVDVTKKIYPVRPYGGQSKGQARITFIHVNPFLVKMKNDLILLDAGLGYKDTRDELLLHQHIRNAGFDPDDVTLVLMSHLHYDHSGGLVTEQHGRMEPSFPKAQYVFQKGEWEFALTGKSSSYKAPIFYALERSANIMLLEGSGEFKPGIRYERSGGHCPYHQVFWLEENGDKYFFGGDELPEPEQLIRRFIAKYDYDGRKAMELREQYGKIAAAEDWKCLFYHAKSNAAGGVQYENEMFTVTKI